jgi:hypothetical protein
VTAHTATNDVRDVVDSEFTEIFAESGAMRVAKPDGSHHVKPDHGRDAAISGNDVSSKEKAKEASGNVGVMRNGGSRKIRQNGGGKQNNGGDDEATRRARRVMNGNVIIKRFSGVVGDKNMTMIRNLRTISFGNRWSINLPLSLIEHLLSRHRNRRRSYNLLKSIG